MFKSVYKKYLSKFERKVQTLNRVEVISRNLLHNYDYFKEKNPQSIIFPVLKSNAYGHGLPQVAEILKQRDTDYLAVDSYFEALRIKEVANKPILLLGYTKPENYKFFDFRNLAITVFDKETISVLGRLGKEIKIHLFVNTGMNREGVLVEEIPRYLDLIKSYPKLNLEGICTHLADADNESNDFIDKQHENFKNALKIVKSKGFDPKYKHISATAGSYKIKNKEMNAIRLGIGLYGFNPCRFFDAGLKPALRLISNVVSGQSLMPGDRVSYGCTFKAKEKMKIGLLPVGYFECFDRRLSNKGYIKVRGRFLPIVGRVCMNLTCFDMKGLNLRVGDEIIAISDVAKDKNSVQSIAKLIDVVPYEVMVKINESIRRVVV